MCQNKKQANVLSDVVSNLFSNYDESKLIWAMYCFTLYTKLSEISSFIHFLHPSAKRNKQF